MTLSWLDLNDADSSRKSPDMSLAFWLAALRFATISVSSPWAVAVRDGLLYIAMAGNHQLWLHLLGSDDVRRYAGTGHEGRRDGRVAVVVERPGDPYNFVEVRGVAEVVEDAAEGAAELRRLAHRYIGRERGDAWMDAMPDTDMVVLVIHPTRVNLITDQEP